VDLEGTYQFNETADLLWSRLIDPQVVASCLPGCEGLEPIGNDTFRVKLTMSVSAISGSYEGTVAIMDKQPPSSYKLRVEGHGRSGFVKGEAFLSLAEQESTTIVTVHGNAEVGGLIARVGQRMLGSVSKMMMDRFFNCLQSKSGS
jgi:carbon monoxide dehydrogenase subunit G